MKPAVLGAGSERPAECGGAFLHPGDPDPRGRGAVAAEVACRWVVDREPQTVRVVPEVDRDRRPGRVSPGSGQAPRPPAMPDPSREVVVSSVSGAAPR
jgi:hypothetical protein